MSKVTLVVCIVILVTLVACGPNDQIDLAPTNTVTEPATQEPPAPTEIATETPETVPTPTEEDMSETATPTAEASPTSEASPTPETSPTAEASTPEPSPTTQTLTPTPPPPPTTVPDEPVQPEVQVVATNLSIPWAVAFAPDGRIFVTERGGRLRVIEEGNLRAEPVAELPVTAIGEGGLMGLALDPDFAANGHLYMMYTYTEGSQILNRISRFTLTDAGLQNESILINAIPGARFHNGGRLVFGPDGMLYATTGDALVPDLAQDIGSLAGKILRFNRDGSVPADNPFEGSYVYSYGHRNPQGLAWQPGTNVLFTVEHGPTGEFGLCCRDELNRIIPGGNYGWPYVSGATIINAEQAAAHDLIGPVSTSGPDATWAPAGAAFYSGESLAAWQGDLFFAGLRGAHLRRVILGGEDQGQLIEEEILFQGTYGRIRDVIMGPDGYLYLSTSNRDGRGQPAAQDDRILRIVPAN